MGVPYEFSERKKYIVDKNGGIASHRGHDQEPGVWSDDTSLSLCMLDSLALGLDYGDMMDKFLLWLEHGEYSANGEVFDVGRTTKAALKRYKKGIEPCECGGIELWDNGNGALMRMFPIALYLHNQEKYCCKSINEDINEIVCNAASLTHAHPINLIACNIYVEITRYILGNESLRNAIRKGIVNVFGFYQEKKKYLQYFKVYTRLIQIDNFDKILLENIKSSGYVVDTLEAAIWCLLTTSNYRDCILRAISLGDDTDTIASIAGGIAGVYYGLESIPVEWMEILVNKGEIWRICKNWYDLQNQLPPLSP